MQRRQFLRALGVTSVAGALAGCPQQPDRERTPTRSPTTRRVTPTGTEEPSFASRFDTVVDLGSEGADPTGDELINPLLEGHAADDTLITVPEGTYRIGSGLRFEELSNFGIVSTGDTRPTLVPSAPAEEVPGNETIIRLVGEDLFLGGLQWDFRNDGYGGRVVVIADEGDLGVFDMHTVGALPGYIDGLWVECRDERGIGRLEGIAMRDGARAGPTATGIQVGARHAGEMHIRDCDVWHFPSKGIYASAPASEIGRGGTVHVDGGTFKNNNDCDIRIGSAGSTVRNIHSIKKNTRQGETIRWKNPIPRRHWRIDGEWRTDIVQARSIRLKNGSNVLVENCRFDHEVGNGAGIITAESSHGGGSTIRDCQLYVRDAEIYPVLLQDGQNGFTLENVSITGRTERNVGIRIESGRHGTVTRNCRIDLANGNGIQIDGVNNYEVTGLDIDVPGRQIIFTDPDDAGSESATRTDAETPSLHTIRISAENGRSVSYRLQVSGRLESVPGVDGPGVVNRVAEGVLDRTNTAFRFSGDIVQLSVSPPGVAVIDA